MAPKVEEAPTEMHPTAGFVIKARTRKDNAKVFINVTSHEMVDPPLNAKDRPVSEAHLDEKGMESLRVPQFAGHSREDELAKYIDVVFHPMVVRRALQGPLCKYYQQRLLLLSVPFVEAETDVLLNHATVKLLKNCAYKSGGGVNRRTPWPITVECGDTAAPAPKKRLDQTRVASAYDDLMGEGSAGLKLHEGKLQGVPKKAVVKKGFLNSEKVRKEGTGMYDENGSGEGVLPEGAGDPMGWMPKKLRGMCQVVDTSSQPAAAQQQAMEQYAEHGNKPAGLPSRVTEEEFNKMSAAERKLYMPEDTSAGGTAEAAGSDLLAKAAAAMGGGGDALGSGDMGEAIASFAEMLGAGEFGDPSMAGELADSIMGMHKGAPSEGAGLVDGLFGLQEDAAQAAAAREARIKPSPVTDEELDAIPLCDDEEEDEEEGVSEPEHSVSVGADDLLVATVQLLGVTSLATVELEVERCSIDIQVPGAYSLSARLCKPIDVDQVKASFDKASQVLTIKAPVL